MVCYIFVYIITVLANNRSDEVVVLNFTNFEDRTIRMYLDLIHGIIKPYENVLLEDFIEFLRFLLNGVDLDIGKKSNFEIDLLNHCFEILMNFELEDEIIYRIAVFLANIQSDTIDTFLTRFIKRLTEQKFITAVNKATKFLDETKKYFDVLIDTNKFRDFYFDFLLPKNNKVDLIFIGARALPDLLSY